MFVYLFKAPSCDLNLLFNDEATVIALLEIYNLYWNKTTRYFTCHSKTDKTAPPIYLQRLIGNVPDGLVGDHVNGDLYDFRSVNIMAITQAENCQKQQKTLFYAGISTTSRYKGNGWNKKTKKWYAYIRVEDVLLNLGNYSNPELAAVVYNVFARHFFRKFANLNKVKVTKAELAQVDFGKLKKRVIKNLNKHGRFDVAEKLMGLE